MHYIKISFEVIADRKHYANVIWQLSAKLLGTRWTVWGRGSGLKSGLFNNPRARHITECILIKISYTTLRRKREKEKNSAVHSVLLYFPHPNLRQVWLFPTMQKVEGFHFYHQMWRRAGPLWTPWKFKVPTSKYSHPSVRNMNHLRGFCLLQTTFFCLCSFTVNSLFPAWYRV